MLDLPYTPEEAMAPKPLALRQDYSSEASKLEEMKGKIAKAETTLLKMQVSAKKAVEEREECIRNLIEAVRETRKQRDEARHRIQLLRCNFAFQANNTRTLRDNGYDGYDYRRLEMSVGKSMLPEKGKLWDAVIDAGAPLRDSGLLPRQQIEDSGIVFRVDGCVMNSVGQSAEFGGGGKGWWSPIDGSWNELAKIFECPRAGSEETEL